MVDRVIWGKIVNWTRGLGKKIEGGKAQEIFNFTSIMKLFQKKEIAFRFWNGKGRRKDQSV